MKLYYSGATEGGQAQTSPNLSLGGFVSGTPLPNGSINNLFGGISQYSKEKAIKQVRAIVLKNETGATVNTPTVWYDNLSVSPITNYRFAFVLLAQNSCGWFMEIIGQGDALPINATFIDPRTQVNAVTLPAIPDQGYIGIWIERTFNTTAVNNADSCENLLAQFESGNKYQVSTIKVVGDTANSLDGKYFSLNTNTEKFTVWFTTGAGATQPTTIGRELIKVTIATGDDATTVATKLLSQLNLLIAPRGEASFTASTDTITITSTAYGVVANNADVNAGIVAAIVTAGSYNGLESIENMQLSINY
jgi:hypothetical protein